MIICFKIYTTYSLGFEKTPEEIDLPRTSFQVLVTAFSIFIYFSIGLGAMKLELRHKHLIRHIREHENTANVKYIGYDTSIYFIY